MLPCCAVLAWRSLGVVLGCCQRNGCTQRLTRPYPAKDHHPNHHHLTTSGLRRRPIRQKHADHFCGTKRGSISIRVAVLVAFPLHG
ncbi:hypothetical protein B0I35DRAFT_36107 [Stachybotrys elegans]|uniref:Secreted protein n=1 Tax=Stachybotrys elegans TaxID=80388 RepID=A0A8K0T2P5_9HYPO|nr:hypothetical protein B0I35DRAFT_36107 [Stachybotrys elegans]